MKVYYINIVDYDDGDSKISPIFSSKEKVIKYLENNFAKGGFNHDRSIEDIIKVERFENRFTIETTRKSYSKDGSLIRSWSFSSSFEIIEEEVL